MNGSKIKHNTAKLPIWVLRFVLCLPFGYSMFAEKKVKDVTTNQAMKSRVELVNLTKLIQSVNL